MILALRCYCLQWARQRNAKLNELQTASALSRVMQRTGRRREARAMLAEVYGWFTEGVCGELLISRIDQQFATDRLETDGVFLRKFSLTFGQIRISYKH